jgi:hypothetical protein
MVIQPATAIDVAPLIGWLMLAAIWITMGAIGGAIGNRREAGSDGFLLGLFLGPFGWVIAWVLDGRRRCPACRERIFWGAQICAHCRSLLAWPVRRRRNSQPHLRQ